MTQLCIVLEDLLDVILFIERFQMVLLSSNKDVNYNLLETQLPGNFCISNAIFVLLSLCTCIHMYMQLIKSAKKEAI